jgi:hypothetical protein
MLTARVCKYRSSVGVFHTSECQFFIMWARYQPKTSANWVVTEVSYVCVVYINNINKTCYFIYVCMLKFVTVYTILVTSHYPKLLQFAVAFSSYLFLTSHYNIEGSWQPLTNTVWSQCTKHNESNVHMYYILRSHFVFVLHCN